MDPIALSVFSSRIEAVCDEMGAVLKRVAFSPNIKDRLDFSCAVFDTEGELCAQAAHIPVHLGSMAYAAKDIVSGIDWNPGDIIVLNDPYLGGTHLPDITLISPVYLQNELLGFVANRAHHADIGASTPGSMPVSSELCQEGLVIPPTHLVRNGHVDTEQMNHLLGNLQNRAQSFGDFSAQISANQRGVQRLLDMVTSLGKEEYRQGLRALNDYASRVAKEALKEINDGVYAFQDYMDDDGQGNKNIPVKATITASGGNILVDFSGTAKQVDGNINCPLSVAAAAVYYVFRCLMPANIPACAGSFRHLRLVAEKGSLLNAQRPAAVAAGNVETSTRVVDVVMGALAQAIPGKIPAASQGSMNNLAMGSTGNMGHRAWDYYETMGGGMGASHLYNGLSGVQTHMTNTLNTPVEVLEMNYPLRVNQYALRHDSAGEGQHKGGEGVIRSYTLLQDTHVTLLTERRMQRPWGISGGEIDNRIHNDCAVNAATGQNLVNGEVCPAKFSRELKAGDCLTVKTPGGGGYND